MIEWKSPPDPPNGPRGGAGKWSPVALELRQHPGEWGLINRAGGSSSFAAEIKNGKCKGFEPAGAFEAKARATPGHRGKFDTYARYVGER